MTFTPCALPCRTPDACAEDGVCCYEEGVAGQQERERGYMPPAKKQDWETPPELFDALDQEFGPFTCDPACLTRQRSAQRVLNRRGLIYCAPLRDTDTVEPTPCDEGMRGYNGLTQPWRGIVYLNPPYGRAAPRWIEKAVSEVEAGNCERVVALIPARTATKMWQRFMVRQAGPMTTLDYKVDAHALVSVVRFLPGRVKFVGAEAGAPFPSAVVVWERPPRPRRHDLLDA